VWGALPRVLAFSIKERSLRGAMAGVVIADRVRVVIQGLSGIVRNHPGLRVVGQAERGHAAIRLVRELKPDILVMDKSFPDLSGKAAVLQALRVSPETRVIIFAVRSQAEDVLELYRAGVSAYVLKEAPVSELLDAVDAAIRGDGYINPKASLIPRRYVKMLFKDKRFKVGMEDLGHREREVFRLLAEGKSVSDIADLMGTSKKTVESQKYKIMEKLCACTVADLTRIAVRRNVIKL